MDLIDICMQNYSQQNGGYSWILDLIIVDVFTRF